MRAPARRLRRSLEAARFEHVRDAAGPLRERVQREPLLSSFFLVDAQGDRAFPATPSEPPPGRWPAVAPLVGGLTGGAALPDPSAMLEAAGVLARNDLPRAVRLLERIAREAPPAARAAALYDLGRLQEGDDLAGHVEGVAEGSAPLGALLNAQELAYAALATYPIDQIDLKGRPSAAWGRFRLALLAEATGQGTVHQRVESLLSEMESSALRLPAKTVTELSERTAALLDDPDTTARAQAVAEQRWAAERRVERLASAFGSLLKIALDEASRRRADDDEVTAGNPFKARLQGREQLLIPETLLDAAGHVVGLAAVEVDMDALRAAMTRQVSRVPNSELVAYEADADAGADTARARLVAPMQHLAVAVHAGPELRTAVEDALDLPRETVQLWAIALSVGGLLAGVLVTTRTIHREGKAAQLKSDFVSNVTHELKTPLTSIRMFLETLLLGRVTDEAEARECLEVMDRETQRLARLIEKLLVFSRIENKKWRVRFSSEDPNELVAESIKILADQLGSTPKELGIEVVAVQDVPLVPMDRFAMAEALLNLLHNAWKYSPDPDRKVRIVLTNRPKQFEIAVEDNGMGVPARDRRRIFVKFERGSNAEKSRVEGSGIGLTLATEIVRAHGGELRYAPLKPKGSRFAILLPR